MKSCKAIVCPHNFRFGFLRLKQKHLGKMPSHRLGAVSDSSCRNLSNKMRCFYTNRSSRRRMKVSKESMNRLVMDYLVGKGYRDVAEAFWRDSGTKPHIELQLVQERMSIQQLLLKGQIQEARSKLTSMDPEFFKKNCSMDFLLAKQELIELIRVHNIEEALQFAMKYLAPFGYKSPQFLNEIERTMSMVAFKNPSDSPLRHMFEQCQRRRVANDLNSAILRSQNQKLEPLLPSMVQHFQYMENQLKAKLSQRPRGIQIHQSTS
ncbi:hypothetical protein CCR75_000078 [Bremia lactucae]|uniref:CTLH domain-containing protein n=1 Tax=Bremia lactucae TaxID=4779 RepID=A0A976FID2_BRELC|nr:hypothetical protein CCR75_000078 [Bremia lactucae]